MAIKLIVTLACLTLASSEAPYSSSAASEAASSLLKGVLTRSSFGKGLEQAPYSSSAASDAAALLKDSLQQEGTTKESEKEDALEEAALTEAALQDDGTGLGLDDSPPATIAPAPTTVTKAKVLPVAPALPAKAATPVVPAVPAATAAPPVQAVPAATAAPAKIAPAPIADAKPTIAAVRPHLRGQGANVASEPHNDTAHGSIADAAGWTNTSEKTSGMEKTLTDLLLGKASFGATPFGGSVATITDLIEKDMMPKVLAAHTANQRELDKLINELHDCGKTKDQGVEKADEKKLLYLKMSPLHKTCRAGEAGKNTEKIECLNDLKVKHGLMKMKCKEFAFVYKKYGDTNANRQIVKKGGLEHTESYLKRITATVCGKYDKQKQGNGGGGREGFLDFYMIGKEACVKATNLYHVQHKKCVRITSEHRARRKTCDNLQDQMDGASCKRAIDMKDACEAYAECYYDKRKVYEDTENMVKIEERDRQAEWRGLKRMQCLMKSFGDGKVSASEVDTCKKRIYDVGHLVVKYPKTPKLHTCTVPDEYPSTAQYKLAQFASLPALAKGRTDANECTGVIEIATTPNALAKNPKTCKCERMTLNGPYAPGPLVRCANCLEVRRSDDTNSCPFGTKIFSPQSQSDWKTIFASVGELENPYFIVDVTRPQNGCGGCTRKPMNSGPGGQAHHWHTSDGSPWWLRSETYKEPNGNYHSNCYLSMFKPWKPENLRFDDDGCKFSAKSYYCQLKQVSTTPKKGSPTACKCEKVALTGTYSAGALLKCEGCWRVSKSTEKNSCPIGTKLFSPGSQKDWKTVLDSIKPLRSPSWIIDVTRPQNGCGGCTSKPMNWKEPSQGTWRTSDGSPWWLRSSRYSEPNGDYFANCYMDLWHTPPNENSVTFNDAKCKYNSNAYYCQPVKKRSKRKQLER